MPTCNICGIRYTKLPDSPDGPYCMGCDTSADPKKKAAIKKYKQEIHEVLDHIINHLDPPRPPWWKKTLHFILLRTTNATRALLILLYALILFVPITTLAIIWHGNLEEGIEIGCTPIDKLQKKDPKDET